MSTSFSSFDGVRVAVTGASRGIGLGIARGFARAGARVLLTARGEQHLAEVAHALRAEGGDVQHAALDVSTGAGCAALAAAVADQLGGLDVLCANAGIFPKAELTAMTEADLDEVLSVNVKGTVLAVAACAPLLSASPRGRVVLTSSITGPITGDAGWSHYGASKAAQLGFMRTAAIELAPHGVTVNAVLPGNVLTEGLHELGAEYLQTMADAVPLGRLGTVDDIAAAALFFASEQAGYVTGQSLVVDGGQVLPEG
ncbi:3-oxoacyl-[acyl-carrier protein] reductase [Quadrisphaera granulorum]|uniref:3-oxoacyl-[acyl-carrier protein] reductase n=1 Tax=Quadrisphaera granulorum TaxID=317664 RepID=A0A315ZU21_9ACTN|nr:3-oxoacyl-ACP reductase FabG [Quadrisphaera granulorum]PWJ49046.1 3-oxoacyl-[acyl-carrier protein] reductase [Quadrisphaera granulorum]SZE98256.1 3-oxoacyl-[acyl-carrier protein] reductase [Quadrisphaera granulorum]